MHNTTDDMLHHTYSNIIVNSVLWTRYDTETLKLHHIWCMTDVTIMVTCLDHNVGVIFVFIPAFGTPLTATAGQMAIPLVYCYCLAHPFTAGPATIHLAGQPTSLLPLAIHAHKNCGSVAQSAVCRCCGHLRRLQSTTAELNFLYINWTCSYRLYLNCTRFAAALRLVFPRKWHCIALYFRRINLFQLFPHDC